jgi:uncharacterized protein YacL
MRFRSQQDFAAGLTFFCTGAGFAIVSTNYSMGTAERMGPGYFPLGLGVLLTILGAIILARSFAKTAQADRLTKWNLKGIFLILGSVVLFAFLLRQLGLVSAVIITVIVSALADRGFKLPGTLVTAAVLIVICVAGFVYGLGLQMPIWPPSLAS